MTNNELESVAVSKNQFGSYDINFMLTADGAKILFDYTTENVGSFLGIVLDKKVISSPKFASLICMTIIILFPFKLKLTLTCWHSS